MLINPELKDALKNQPAVPRFFHIAQDKRISAGNGRLHDVVSLGARVLAGTVFIFTASGCIATRSWVQGQLQPITGRLDRQESAVNDAGAKSDRALAQLQNLRLEERLVLDSNHGPIFAFGSAALTKDAKHEIDGFFQDLEGSANSTPEPGRLFVIAGHTDDVGGEGYNYELGQRRAERVAGYVVGKEGVDPAQVRVVSYGASKPIADNATKLGRRSNRRVEILVYQQKIATGS
jgi:outer membrane protein OmpA-like peptidoglycan-associated protein